MDLLFLLFRTAYSSSSVDEFVMYAVAGVFIGIYAFYYGFTQWNKFKKVADTTTSKVRSMAAGLVELNGKTIAIKALTSPVSKQGCVYYKVEHQTYIRSEKGGHWITTSIDQEYENFYLQDDTGKVEVDPRKADIDIPQKKVQYYGSRRDIEYFLSPDGDCYVLGTAKIRPGVRTVDNAASLIVTQGEGDNTFYITDKKEQDVQKNLYQRAQIGIIAGLMLTTISFGYLIFKFLI